MYVLTSDVYGGGLHLMCISFAKEPYKRDDILQKRPIILRSLLIEATPYVLIYSFAYIHMYRVAKTHRIPYLDRSISAKVSYI